MQVSCETPAAARALAALWQRLALLDDCPSEGPLLEIRFDLPRGAVPEGDEIFRSGSLRVQRNERGFVLRCGASFLTATPEQARARGRLADDFWQQEAYDQREFFLLVLLMLLQPHDRFGLHANALVRQEQGVLLVGRSGAGKTTLALGLVAGGWSFLSDDASLLVAGPAGVEAHAFRRGFSVTAETEAAFPQLHLTRAPCLYLAQGKRVLDLQSHLPEQTERATVPRLLLFPQVAEGPDTVVAPLGRTEVLLRLSRESAGILTANEASKRQLELLRDLVTQAPAFTLELGTDVLTEPERVTSLLEEVLAEPHGQDRR